MFKSLEMHFKYDVYDDNDDDDEKQLGKPFSQK